MPSIHFKAPVLLLLCILFLGSGCKRSDRDSHQQAAQRPARPALLVKTELVRLHNLTDVLEVPGTIEPESIANVLSSSEGKITQMNAREGDKVKEGQVLAMLSPLLREDIINAARLNLGAKKRSVEQYPDDAVRALELQQARSDYEFALNQYREIPVMAPVNGIIADRRVDMGDMVAARHKLFEIQSNTQLLVIVPVSELDIRKLIIGQSVSISSDACPAQLFQGTIQRIYPRVDRQSRSATVEVLLPDPCPQLRVGMFVRASFITRSVQNALAVPVTALIQRGQQQLVFIVVDQEAVEIPVETGLESKGMIEIVSGLEEGQQLVIEGQEQLQSGRPVRILQSATETASEGGLQ